MKIYSLTCHSYLRFGLSYEKLHWNDSWEIFLTMRDNEIKQVPFNDRRYLCTTIGWYDREVLQKIAEGNWHTINAFTEFKTLLVKLRIACSMINKIPGEILNLELKKTLSTNFTETFYDAHKQWMEFYYKWIIQLPF